MFSNVMLQTKYFWPGVENQLVSGIRYKQLHRLAFASPCTNIRQHPISIVASAGRSFAARPDAAVLEARRAEIAACGGSLLPSAPRGSLFALDLTAQRNRPEQLRTISNRFPFRDFFDLGNGQYATSSQILDHIIPQIESRRLQKIEEVVAGRAFTVVPVLEGIYDKGNIGAVARSADALGYGSLHYVRTRDPRSFKAATSGKRTSGGAQKWLDMQVWESSAACFQHFRDAGYCIAATSLAPASVPITDVDWTKPTVIVMGNESYGVSNEALKFADKTVIIPQAPGFVDSFNVSVAAAITLYEARTSRARVLGQHADLKEGQHNVLLAAMLLRHKDCNAIVRKAYGLNLDTLEPLDKLGPFMLSFTSFWLNFQTQFKICSSSDLVVVPYKPRAAELLGVEWDNSKQTNFQKTKKIVKETQHQALYIERKILEEVLTTSKPS